MHNRCKGITIRKSCNTLFIYFANNNMFFFVEYEVFGNNCLYLSFEYLIYFTRNYIIMKRFLLFLSFLLCLLPMLQAQKVGLVLSGGGAKGMTHIGIIRALEENNIPIDYITGTSMGAIIGSLYAMGYSPDDMEALLRSPDFKRWYSGKVESKYEYYFKKGRPTPEFLTFVLLLKTHCM